MIKGDDPTFDALIGEWMREEAFNLEKIFSGEPRLNFSEWKFQRGLRGSTERKADA